MTAQRLTASCAALLCLLAGACGREETWLAPQVRLVGAVAEASSVGRRSTATLADLSADRYVLGLGVSTPAIVEGLHDLTFERPAAKLADVVTKVRSLLAGDRAQLYVFREHAPVRMPHVSSVLVDGTPCYLWLHCATLAVAVSATP